MSRHGPCPPRSGVLEMSRGPKVMPFLADPVRVIERDRRAKPGLLLRRRTVARASSVQLGRPGIVGYCTPARVHAHGRLSRHSQKRLSHYTRLELRHLIDITLRVARQILFRLTRMKHLLALKAILCYPERPVNLLLLRVGKGNPSSQLSTRRGSPHFAEAGTLPSRFPSLKTAF